jgi:hypothetical protein
VLDSVGFHLKISQQLFVPTEILLNDLHINERFARPGLNRLRVEDLPVANLLWINLFTSSLELVTW